MIRTEYEYLVAYRDFLLTYPYDTPYDKLLIDYGDIIANQNSDEFGAGAAIRSTGDIIVSKIKVNLQGKELHNRRSNASLIMWRHTNDNEFRRDISNFINRLMNWVNDENMKRFTINMNPMLPNFSMTETETISADGGIRTAIIDNIRSEFSIQLHNDYQIIYEPQNEFYKQLTGG